MGNSNCPKKVKTLPLKTQDNNLKKKQFSVKTVGIFCNKIENMHHLSFQN